MIMTRYPVHPERRVAMTFRVREDVATYVRERAAELGVSQVTLVEEAILREWRDERRRLAQEAALLDAAENTEFAAAALGAARESLGTGPEANGTGHGRA